MGGSLNVSRRKSFAPCMRTAFASILKPLYISKQISFVSTIIDVILANVNKKTVKNKKILALQNFTLLKQ